tara:strand:- start:2065 stop:2298 length:234 start_codon:yes stop_codon:yes gene_type:complete
MAIKVASTSVFNNSNQIDWSLISSKPQYISSLIKTSAGDNNNSYGSPSCNVAYHAANTTLQIWFNTNCACACACDGG